MRHYLISRNTRDVLLLAAVLAGLFACVANACAEVTAPIRPCEYVAKPLTDSTSVVAYKTLPCWDESMQRVVRER